MDHRHKLQMRLLVLCRRTLACSVGRGALTLWSLQPLMAEALPHPPLSLTGRVPPNNSALQLDTQAAPAELALWPEFHNGVAAGLRVNTGGPGRHDYHSRGGRWGPRGGGTMRGPRAGSSSSTSSGGGGAVTRNWIIYNRTATADSQSFHAGVLLALGLQGHLSVLSVTDICDYLTQVAPSLRPFIWPHFNPVAGPELAR